MSGMTAEAARHFAKVWIAEMRAEGGRLPDGGLIFTYAGPAGEAGELYVFEGWQSAEIDDDLRKS